MTASASASQNTWPGRSGGAIGKCRYASVRDGPAGPVIAAPVSTAQPPRRAGRRTSGVTTLVGSGMLDS